MTISSLKENSRPNGYKKIKGRNTYHIRTGDYQIIYSVFDNKLIIDILTHERRNEVYE